MAHLKIDEAIKTIKAKTGQTLTYREIARLCEMRELQVCFKWWAGNCHLSIISNDERFDLVSEVKLIGMRSAKFSEELYLTPSYHHEDAVFRAIANNSKDPVGVQIVRGLYGKQRELLLMQDVSDHYLYEIESEYRNGWQLFKSPKRFFEFEREDGAFASYTITVDDLLITNNSLSAYIAKVKAKPKKEVDEYSLDQTKKLAKRLARHVIKQDPESIVSKSQLAKSIINELVGTEHYKNIKGDREEKEENVRNWIAELSGNWKGGRKSNSQNEQMRALISEAIADFPEEINRQK